MIMDVAFVLPSLAKKGPIIVVQDIINNFPPGWLVTVYYFDDIIEVAFPPYVKLVNLKSFLSLVDLSRHDLVHSHLLRSDLFCSLNRRCINFLLTTVHSDIIHETQMSHGVILGYMYGTFWVNILRFSDQVVFLTDFQKNKFNFIKKSQTIYNGRPEYSQLNYINVENKIMLDIISNNGGKKILGACANVLKRKGYNQVVDFLHDDIDSEYIFVLVGDGPDLGDLKNYSLEKGVLNKCYFINKTNDVNNFLRFFDIFIMTSYSEGMPLALLEAAAHKLPIVCSDIPVVQEIFSATEIFYYKLGNIESLASAIGNVKECGDEYSYNAYRKFKREFTSSTMSVNYQKLYLKYS
jgi:glycosyltransferase involved in cell wall biosynthesis